MIMINHILRVGLPVIHIFKPQLFERWCCHSLFDIISLVECFAYIFIPFSTLISIFHQPPPSPPQSWRNTDVNMTHDAARANGTSILNSNIGATVTSMANGSWYRRNSSLDANGLIIKCSFLKYEGQRTLERGRWTLNSPSCCRIPSCLMGLRGGCTMMGTSDIRTDEKHPSMPPSKKCRKER